MGLIDDLFGIGIDSQARKELAAEQRRMQVNGRKNKIRDKRMARQGFKHNVNGRFWDLIVGGGD